jgi:hypothetical protein
MRQLAAPGASLVGSNVDRKRGDGVPDGRE